MVCFSILSTKKRRGNMMSAAASSRSTAGSIDLARRWRRDDDNNNNDNRNKRRNISNQRVKVGAIGEVIRFRNFETSWNSNEKTLAFERKDERFRDVQFRENQFRLLEPLLVPLLGEEGTAELILTCPEVLGMDARQMGWTLVLLSGDDEGDSLVDIAKTTPERLVLSEEDIARMKRERSKMYTEQKKRAVLKAREAVAKFSQTMMQNVASSNDNARMSRDGRTEGGNAKYAVQGTLKGTSTREGDIIARFWNLWGGSNRCRQILTKSARDSIYRTPGRLEAKLLALDRVFPFLDVPLFMHKEPRLFEVDTNELIMRVAKCRDVFRSGSVAHAVTLAPGILLEDLEEVKEALCSFKRNNNLRSEHEVYEESCTLFMALNAKMNKARPNDPEILYAESLKAHVIEGNVGCSI
jgi:hypothetical protein